MIDLFFQRLCIREHYHTHKYLSAGFSSCRFSFLVFSFRKKSIDSRPGKGETPKNITRSLIIITLGGWVVDSQSMPFVSMLV